jgi:hypothetical protein
MLRLSLAILAAAEMLLAVACASPTTGPVGTAGGSGSGGASGSGGGGGSSGSGGGSGGSGSSSGGCSSSGPSTPFDGTWTCWGTVNEFGYPQDAGPTPLVVCNSNSPNGGISLTLSDDAGDFCAFNAFPPKSGGVWTGSGSCTNYYGQPSPVTTFSTWLDGGMLEYSELGNTVQETASCIRN